MMPRRYFATQLLTPESTSGLTIVSPQRTPRTGIQEEDHAPVDAARTLDAGDAGCGHVPGERAPRRRCRGDDQPDRGSAPRDGMVIVEQPRVHVQRGHDP